MKIGISTYTWYELPLENMLSLLMDTGFQAISLGSRKEHSNYHTKEGRKKISTLLKNYDMELDSVHAPSGFRDGKLIDISSNDVYIREYAINETIHSIHAAADCGASYVVIHPTGSKWKKEFDLINRSETALKSLEILVRYAERYNITLALENLDPPESILFDQIYKRAITLGLVFCYDSGHALIGNNHKEYWDLMKTNVRTLHLHDNNGEIDSHSIPGSGIFPWKDFSKWLEAENYTGILGLECKFREQNEQRFRSWLEECFKFIQNTFK